MVTGNVIQIIEMEVDISGVAVAAAAEEMKVTVEIPVRIMVKVIIKIIVRVMVRVTISSHIIPAKEILTGAIIEAAEAIIMKGKKVEEAEEEAVEFKVDGIRGLTILVPIAINAAVITEVEDDNTTKVILFVFLMTVEAYCALP